jgi:hypothetical protein
MVLGRSGILLEDGLRGRNVILERDEDENMQEERERERKKKEESCSRKLLISLENGF